MDLRLQRFEPEIEDAFEAHYSAQTVRYLRFFIPIAIVMYIGFAYWDISQSPELLPYTMTIRLAYCLMLSGLFLLTYSDRFRRFSQIAIAATVAVGAFGVAVILYLVPRGMEIGIAGILIVVMYSAGAFRLRVKPGLIAYGLVLASCNALMWSKGLERNLIVSNNIFVVSASALALLYNYFNEYNARTQFSLEQQLRRQKRRTEELLGEILPDHIVKRMGTEPTMVAEGIAEVTVLFADICGFTELTRQLSPGHLVEILSDVFSAFDDLAEQYGVEKIKTIGDAYMVVGGAPEATTGAAERVVAFATEAARAIERYAEEKRLPLRMRIGIATGSAVSGVLGTKKPTYDFWGDTVNLASRMEETGVPGRIQVSESTYWRLQAHYSFEARGQVACEGIGQCPAYLLIDPGSIPPTDL